MSARNRCLCQSRLMIWLMGLIIQFKRGGLGIRRFFVSVSHAFGMILSAWLGFFSWLFGWPRAIVGWLWSSLFWPVEKTELPCRGIAHSGKTSRKPIR